MDKENSYQPSAWLPELLPFTLYNGDWEQYLEALYECFKKDFIRSKPIFNGIKLALKKHPLSKNKEATFWHIISEGKIENERTPCMRRCERIKWPKPVIENSQELFIKVWQEPKNGEDRIHLWFESEAYLVVLAKRKDYILLWTAYVVEQKHQREKLNKRWINYKDH